MCYYYYYYGYLYCIIWSIFKHEEKIKKMKDIIIMLKKLKINISLYKKYKKKENNELCNLLELSNQKYITIKIQRYDDTIDNTRFYINYYNSNSSNTSISLDMYQRMYKYYNSSLIMVQQNSLYNNFNIDTIVKQMSVDIYYINNVKNIGNIQIMGDIDPNNYNINVYTVYGGYFNESFVKVDLINNHIRLCEDDDCFVNMLVKTTKLPS